MSYDVVRETFDIQNVVTIDHYSEEKSTVAGTDGEEFAMGTIMIYDAAATSWRKAVAVDIPDTSGGLSVATPILGIVKNKFNLVGTSQSVAGMLRMGEVQRKLTNLSTLTGKTADAELSMSKTGLFMIGRA